MNAIRLKQIGGATTRATKYHTFTISLPVARKPITKNSEAPNQLKLASLTIVMVIALYRIM
jgi:hypothetical protein